MAAAMEGRIYSHYKDPSKRYRVLHIGVIQESDLTPRVIYEQLYHDPQYPWGTKWDRAQESFEGFTSEGVERFKLEEN